MIKISNISYNQILEGLNFICLLNMPITIVNRKLGTDPKLRPPRFPPRVTVSKLWRNQSRWRASRSSALEMSRYAFTWNTSETLFWVFHKSTKLLSMSGHNLTHLAPSSDGNWSLNHQIKYTREGKHVNIGCWDDQWPMRPHVTRCDQVAHGGS